MKLWREQVKFSRDLRGARIAASGSAAELQERRVREREQAAFERGREEGERRLSEQLVQQRAELQELQLGIMHSLGAAIPKVAREMEPILVELALEAARKLVGELPVTAAMVEHVIRDALGQVEDSAELKVFLQADDLKLLQQSQSPLLQENPQQPIRFASSPEVTRGGCLVQTRFGCFDARRETKVKLLKEALQL